MKSLSLFVCALAMTIGVNQAQADNYPKESLKKINAFLAKLVEGELGAKFEITKAKVGKDKLISETRFEAAMKDFSGELALKMKGEQVVAAAEFTQPGLDEELAPEKAAVELNKIAKKINDKGFYKATVKAESNGKGAKLTFEMEPASKEAISIDSVKVQLQIGTEKGKEFTKVGLKGKFNVKSDLVLNARKSLTTIFDKIAADSFPEGEDYAGLLAVLAEIVEFMDKEGE